MPLVLGHPSNDEYGLMVSFAIGNEFNRGALVGNIKIMIEPATEFFGEAAKVGLADFDFGLIDEGPEWDGEVVFHGSDG